MYWVFVVKVNNPSSPFDGETKSITVENEDSFQSAKLNATVQAEREVGLDGLLKWDFHQIWIEENDEKYEFGG